MLIRSLLLALALLGLGIHAAAAHAVLIGQEPADGAVVDAAPAAISLHFNEAVTPLLVTVQSARGDPVTLAGEPRAIDRSVIVALPPDLAAGRYIVSWRVISGDSHPVAGAFVFGLGVADALTGPVPPSGETPWPMLKILLRWVQDLGLLIAAGGALLAVLVTRGHAASAVAAPWAIGAALLAAAASIGVQGALMAQSPPAALVTPAPWVLGAGTPIGLGVLIMAAGLSLMIAGQRLRASRLAATLIVLGAASALASLTASGHGATAEPRWLARPALILHVLCAAFWLGSLWPLLVLARRGARPGLHRVLRRFSAIAMPAVALLICAGAAVAVTRINAVGDLTGGPYGLLLLGKLAGFGLLVALAAVNRFALMPRLLRPGNAAGSWLTRSIGAELTIGLGILAVTAVLAHTPPPARPMHDHAAAPVTILAVADRHMLILTVDPARPGPNLITLEITDGDQRPVEAIEMILWASLPERGMEAVRRAAVRSGPGRFTVAADMLPIPGRWMIRVDALVTDFEKAIFEVALPLPWPR